MPAREQKTSEVSQPISRLITLLNQCIEASVDGEKMYAIAAADVRDPSLKDLFLRWSRDRAEFVVNLQRAVQRYGAFPLNEGSARGAAHRGWSALVRAARGPNDRIVIEQCERGDRLALRALADAIRSPAFQLAPVELRSMIEREYDTCHAALGELRRRVSV
jgi:uncharacterized protein (TIGR02284 family)